MENYLSEKTFELHDGWCGETIAWYRTIKNMPSELFDKNRDKIEYVNGMWVYLVRTITRKECIKLYGNITDEEYGPRGGWKSVTFGDKKFISEVLRPRRE
jgi:hypothetical protein